MTLHADNRMRRTLSALGAAQAYIGLVLVLAVGIATKGEMFLSETNLTNAIGAFASRGILAVGVTLVILTGGIDLSVGSLLGIASMTAAMMLSKHSLEPWQIVPICMAVGAFFGFLNGAGTAWLRIQSFVMTLAMLSVVRGLDRQVSDNVSVGTQIAGPDGQLTPQAEAFQLFGTPGHNLFGRIYYPVLAFIVVCVVFHLILTKTRFGRHVRRRRQPHGRPAVRCQCHGGHDRGVHPVRHARRVRRAHRRRLQRLGRPQAGQSFELDAIAAAVIGGASLAGGKGTIAGTFVGALILTLLDNVLGLNAVSDNWQLVIKGLIVVVAVVLQRPDLFTFFRGGSRS